MKKIEIGDNLQDILFFIVLFLFLASLSSCEESNETSDTNIQYQDKLTNTEWQYDSINIRFFENERYSYYINTDLQYPGIYEILPDDAVILYKADFDSWPIAYKGQLFTNNLLLYNTTDTLIFKKQ